MKSKNLMLYIALGVMLVFTAVYFIAVNKISYAFVMDDGKALLESKLDSINKMAQIYGEKNLELFEEEDTIYVTVNDLVENGYIIPDDDHGNVKDPSSDVKVLNELKVRITLSDGKIKTKILS